MNTVRIYFTRLPLDGNSGRINDALLEQWLCELSVKKRTSIQRLINEKDRLSSLLGLLLLKRCVEDEGIAGFSLADIYYPKTGKPYWRRKSIQQIDFNISHSGDVIIVAISKTLKVGVDIEKIRSLKYSNYKMVMSPEELTQIRQTPELFFNLWSKKEAVVKAANTTGIVRMRDVNLYKEQAMLDDVCWHLKSLSKLMGLEDAFSVHLATSQLVADIILKDVSADDFMH
jgi:4'-phosphopantetheinyl transferase